MIQDWIPSFLDEMSKVAAAALNEDEKRRQALQSGALGLVAGPTVGMLTNLIQRGHPLPVGVKSVPRWLAGTTAAGLAFGSVVPAMQQRISAKIQNQANERVRSAKPTPPSMPGAPKVGVS